MLTNNYVFFFSFSRYIFRFSLCYGLFRLYFRFQYYFHILFYGLYWFNLIIIALFYFLILWLTLEINFFSWNKYQSNITNVYVENDFSRYFKAYMIAFLCIIKISILVLYIRDPADNTRPRPYCTCWNLFIFSWNKYQSNITNVYVENATNNGEE